MRLRAFAYGNKEWVCMAVMQATSTLESEEDDVTRRH